MERWEVTSREPITKSIIEIFSSEVYEVLIKSLILFC